MITSWYVPNICLEGGIYQGLVVKKFSKELLYLYSATVATIT